MAKPRTLVVITTPSSVSSRRTGRWVRRTHWSTASWPTVALKPISPVRSRGGRPGCTRTLSTCTTSRSTSRPARSMSPNSNTITSTMPSIALTGDSLARALTGRRATRLSVPSSSPMSRSAGEGASSSRTSSAARVSGSSSGDTLKAYGAGSAVEQLRDERGDGTAFRTRERDVAEQRMTTQRVDHRRDAVVAPDAQVVALRDVVCEHDAAALTEARQRREQHRLLEVLRLVEDHERVGEAA